MRSRRRAVLRFALGLALAAIVFAEVVPRIASYGSVGNRLATVSLPWAPGLAAAALLDIVTTRCRGERFCRSSRCIGALAFTQASTALTTPAAGGAALGMALSFGLPAQTAGRSRSRRLRRRGDRDLEPGDDPGLPAHSAPSLVFASGDCRARRPRSPARARPSGALIVGLAVAVLRSPEPPAGWATPPRAQGRVARPLQQASAAAGAARPRRAAGGTAHPAAAGAGRPRPRRRSANQLTALSRASSCPSGRWESRVAQPAAERGASSRGPIGARDQLAAPHPRRSGRRGAGHDRHARRLRRLGAHVRGRGAPLPRLDPPADALVGLASPSRVCAASAPAEPA